MWTRPAGSCLAWRRRTSRIVMRCVRRSGGSRSSTENEDGVPVGEDSERNEFYASKGLYGRVTVKGDLDAINGARLITLLSSLSAPTPEKDGVKDTRTPALRRADGFCELLRRYERAGLGPIEGGDRKSVVEGKRVQGRIEHGCD